MKLEQKISEGTKEKIIDYSILLSSAGLGGAGSFLGLLYIYGSSEMPGSELVGNSTPLMCGSVYLLLGGIALSLFTFERERIKNEDKLSKD